METESNYCGHCENGCRHIFKELEPEPLRFLQEHQSIREYKKGAVIFQQGNQPPGLFIMLSGIVKVYKTDESGKEQIVRLEHEHDLLGYRSLLSEERCSASASALTPVKVCFLPRELFRELLNRSSNLLRRLISILSHDLRVAENKLADMAHKTVRERLAETLLMLSDEYGLEPDGHTLTVTLSREDLANLVGTATETLIRTLSEFRNDGLVELRGKRIVLPDSRRIVRFLREQ